MMINKKLVYSRQARRVKKRNNVTIVFTDPQMPSRVGYGIVEKFLRFPTNNCDYLHVALLKPLNLQPYTVFQSLQYPAEISPFAKYFATDFMTVANECSVIAIPVEHISAVCFNVSTVGSAGVTTLTNECEKDL